MKAVAGQDLLTIEGYDCCTVTSNGGKRIVTHADLPACHGAVRDERGYVWKHMIGCSCVPNQERCMCGLSTLEMDWWWWVVEKCKDCFGKVDDMHTPWFP